MRAKIILIITLLPGFSACNEKDVEYFPLQEGKTWQYHIVTHDMDLEKNFKQHIVNGPERIIDEVKAYTRTINNGTALFYEKNAEGIRRIGIKRKLDINTIFEPEDHYVIRFPVVVGTQWQQETITGVLGVVMDPFRRHYELHTPVQMNYTIESLDESVSVAAGKFNRCISVKGIGTSHVTADKSIGTIDVTVSSMDWYCPNVGLVKSWREESTTSNILVKGDFLMELEKYSMK